MCLEMEFLGAPLEKIKKVSGFWAKNTRPDFGHCLDIGATITSKKAWKLSSLDLTGHSVEGIFVQKVSFFCCHYFVLFLQASKKYMYRQRGHNNSGYVRNEVTVTRYTCSSHTTSFPTHVCTIPQYVHYTQRFETRSLFEWIRRYYSTLRSKIKRVFSFLLQLFWYFS